MILDFTLIMFYGFWCLFITYFLKTSFSPFKHTYRELHAHKKIWLILLGYPVQSLAFAAKMSYNSFHVLIKLLLNNYLGIFLLPILHLEAVPVFWFLFPLNMFMACFYYFVFGLLDLLYLSFNVRCLLTHSVEQSCSLPDLKSKVLAGQRSALVMTPKFLWRIDNRGQL